MDVVRVVAAIESRTEEAIHALLIDDTTVFWVDWGQEDETIADACESVLQTGGLRGEMVYVDSDQGFEVWIHYRDMRAKVPLTYSVDDRHITLCTLNRILAREYEVRFCIDSEGNDSLAFLPLKCDEWAALERQHGKAVARRFYRFGEKPNLFTYRLQLRKRKWWLFGKR
jgi:hypothetical protein